MRTTAEIAISIELCFVAKSCLFLFHAMMVAMLSSLVAAANNAQNIVCIL